MNTNSENTMGAIKQYLIEWNQSGQCPNRFMDKIDGLELLDDKEVVHTLASYLYLVLTGEEYKGNLTHNDVKKPRIYQLLNTVLKNDENERELSLEFLLSILEKEDRDIIEYTVEEEEYTVECFSTLGLTRLKNQDYLGYYQLDNILVMIVADGVGGGDSGEIASEIATNFVIDSLKKFDLLEENNILDILQNIVFEVNKEVLNYAKEHNLGSMGTTLSVAIIIEENMLYIAHVGDSRIYELNSGKKPRQITEDHSEVEILCRLGKIKEEEKAKYKKNILRYAIGVEDLKRENIFVQEQYIHGDTNLLLCSDGLWEKINIDEKLFLKNIDELKEDIYAAIPTDNVTVIRYLSVEKEENSNFEEIKDFEEEFFEESQDEKEKIEIIALEKNVTQKDLIPKKKKSSILKDKRIEKINKVLMGFIFLVTIIGLTYFFINQVFNKEKININNQEESLIEFVKNRDMNKTKLLIDTGIDINLMDENNNTAFHYSYKNMDINMSLLLIQNGIDTRVVKEEIQFDINKTEIKLKEIKAFSKGIDL